MGAGKLCPPESFSVITIEGNDWHETIVERKLVERKILKPKGKDFMAV